MAHLFGLPPPCMSASPIVSSSWRAQIAGSPSSAALHRRWQSLRHRCSTASVRTTCSLASPARDPASPSALQGLPWTPPGRSSSLLPPPCSVAPPATISPPPPIEHPPPEGGKPRPLRRLILMRHADSASPRNVRDHDRPISAAGKQQAREIAKVLMQRGWVPDIVLASNAVRTRQTLEEMAQVIASLGDVDTHLYGSLYTVAALDGQTRQHIEECLLEVVDDQTNFCVAVVGHNKGMEEAASSFGGAAVKLRTASVALLQCMAASWRDVLSVATQPEAQAEAAAPASPAAAGTGEVSGAATVAAAGQRQQQQAGGKGASKGATQKKEGQVKAAAGAGAGAGPGAGAGQPPGCWQLVDVITPAFS